MSASTQFKGLLAGLAAIAIAGSAVAQGTPPNPAVKDPAVGAGQQSSQTTPMGSTGTPAGGGTAAGTSGSAGTTGSTAGASSSSSMGSGSTSMGASGSASTDTTASRSSSRTVKADRN